MSSMFCFSKQISLFFSILLISSYLSSFENESELYNYLKSKNTTSFLIAKKGEILLEYEFIPKKTIFLSMMMQENLIEGRSQEDVASIQKSFVSILIGLAQEKGYLKISDPVSKYLEDWTRSNKEGVEDITIKHLLTMTSGLNKTLDLSKYPGSEWQYTSRPYGQLLYILEFVTEKSIQDLSFDWLFSPLGLDETYWKKRDKRPMGFSTDSSDYGLVTTARDLLKFGDFILNGGEVGTNHIITDIDFFDDSFTQSQPHNPAYGYLWWLNNSDYFIKTSGKGKGNLFPNAPKETILALGSGSKFLAIVPSQEMIVIRLGDRPKDSNFINNLWKYIQN